MISSCENTKIVIFWWFFIFSPSRCLVFFCAAWIEKRLNSIFQHSQKKGKKKIKLKLFIFTVNIFPFSFKYRLEKNGEKGKGRIDVGRVCSKKKLNWKIISKVYQISTVFPRNIIAGCSWVLLLEWDYAEYSTTTLLPFGDIFDGQFSENFTVVCNIPFKHNLYDFPY